ncbi:MAG: hypothetical protein FJ255_01430 [Phycisphaerae bacterium]|nr:hypothetical protein [Phycisphaerae bacterium]
MENQQVEMLGRHRPIDEPMRAGIEVVMPIRDRGVGLLAYIDIDEQAGTLEGESRFEVRAHVEPASRVRPGCRPREPASSSH